MQKYPTAATACNGISITRPYWDERVEAMAKSDPEVNVDKYHIDILTAHFVQKPEMFDVVVASNLFGDILSDLGPACTGTIAIAPSANINPDRTYPSLFEPVHGSAPDIAGKDIANPMAEVLSFAMLLRYSFGMIAEADLIENAIAEVLAGGLRTADIMQPGRAKVSTRVMGDAILHELDKHA